MRVRPGSAAAVVAALAAISLSVACAGAGQPAAVEAPPATGVELRFTILQINDVYKVEGLERGRLGGLSRVRTLRKRLEAEGLTGTLLIDFAYPSAPRCRPGGGRCSSFTPEISSFRPS